MVDGVWSVSDYLKEKQKVLQVSQHYRAGTSCGVMFCRDRGCVDNGRKSKKNLPVALRRV